MVFKVGKPGLVASAAIAALCLLAPVPQSADATFPGRPGAIVFNLLTFPSGGDEPTGGLYAILPGQEQPHQLTDNPRDYDPSFAPSGKLLVFRRTGSPQPGIFTLDLGSGRTRRLTSAGSDLDPAFGRHGMVVFSRFFDDSSYDLALREANGRLRRLTSTKANDGAAVFTPDGKRIIFSRDRRHAVLVRGRRALPPKQLYSIRTDGTGLRVFKGCRDALAFDISPDGHHLASAASVSGISYSPDGHRIAYANHEGLWLHRADGQGKPTLILQAEYHNPEKKQLLIQPAWQPLP